MAAWNLSNCVIILTEANFFFQADALADASLTLAYKAKVREMLHTS